ncbi:MAG TPA: Uma2 family endonuclease [Urbifossiella sp.]|nr:Uma2 family endonuclease [Urbifossiella sp.]
MMPALLEPEELQKMPDGDSYELIDGVPTEKKPMGAKSDFTGAALIGLVKPYCRQHKLGLVFGSQAGYRCFPDKPLQVRIPDVSFVASGRLPDDQPPDGYIAIVPDLVVEVASPNDGYEEIQSRVADFQSAKTRLIWVVSPHTRTVLVRRLDGSCAELREDGELSGEDVIPGFRCKVAELFT